MKLLLGSTLIGRLSVLLGIATTCALMLGTGGEAFAQTPPALPAPSNVGTGIPRPYQGPFPSQVNPALVGPVQLLAPGRWTSPIRWLQPSRFRSTRARCATGAPSGSS